MDYGVTDHGRLRVIEGARGMSGDEILAEGSRMLADWLTQRAGELVLADRAQVLAAAAQLRALVRSSPSQASLR
jgi:hypothetical protein